MTKPRQRAAHAGRAGPAHRPEGAQPPDHAAGRAASFHTHRGIAEPRRPHRRPGRAAWSSRSGGTPYVAFRPLLADFTLVDAARRGRGLPQGRGADRGDGRHLPRRAGARGRGGLRRADLLAAARGRGAGHAGLVRARAGLRRHRPAQRRAVLRRPARRPGSWSSASSPRRAGRTSTGSSWTCSPRGSAWTRSASVARARRPGLLLRRHHDPALADRGDRCASTAASTEPAAWETPGPRLARRGPGGPAASTG